MRCVGRVECVSVDINWFSVIKHLAVYGDGVWVLYSVCVAKFIWMCDGET